MRIAHVAPPAGSSASGILTALEGLTIGLARRGHNVQVWHTGAWSSENLSDLARRLGGSGVEIRELPLSKRPASVIPRLRQTVAGDADVLHLHSVFVPANTALARAWPGPLVLTPHGGYHPASLRRSALRKRVYGSLYEKRTVRRSAATIALTEVEAAHIRRYAGDVPTVVAPNGVTDAARIESGRPLRTRLRLDVGERLAVFVGRLDLHHKGLDRLVDAMGLATSWRVALVGPDHRGGRRRIQQIAARRGVSDRLILLGPLAARDLADIYSSADLFVLPSRWEGLPMSLLEGLSAGIPALVSQEVDRLVPISASGSGWVAAPEEFGRALDALARTTTTEWLTRGRAARRLSLRYNWERTAETHEAVYRAALRESLPAADLSPGPTKQ